MCAVETEDDCFRYTDMMCVQYRYWYQFGIGKNTIFFRYRTDTGGIGRYRVQDSSICLTVHSIDIKLSASTFYCQVEIHHTVIV